jgi:hypothetical protein
MKNKLKNTVYLILLFAVLSPTIKTNTTAEDGSGTSPTTTATFTESDATSVKEKTATACEGLDVTVKLQTEDYMSEKREENKNAFTESVDLLIEVYQNQDYMKLLDLKMAFLIVIVLFMVLVLISTVIFLINICCCCCKGQETNKGCCISCNLVLSTIAILGLAGSCIMIAVYVTGVKNRMNEVNCTLNLVNNDLINGNLSVQNFMGFFPLTKIIGQYISDFNNLVTNHKQNLQDIVNFNLESSSKSALDSIDPFHTTNKTRETPDGEGNMNRGHSVTDVMDAAIDGAKTEFNALYETSKAVHEGASAGLEQVNNPDIQSVMDELANVNSLITGIISTFNSSFGSIGDTYNTIDSQYATVQIVFIVFIFVCLLIAFIILSILWLKYHNKGCCNMCCCRIFIALLSIFCLIFMIFSFAVGVVTFATSTSCGLMQQFTKEDGITKFIDLFKLEGEMKNILTTCLLESGTGSLSTIFLQDSSSNQDSSDMFTEVQVLLDMFDSYQSLLDSLPADKMSIAFTTYKDAILKFKSGELPDHDNALSSLGALNQIISCHTEEYSFTTSSCPSGKTCIHLDTVSTYTKPACADSAKDAEAETLVTNLNSYITQTKTLVDDLVAKSYDTATTPSTPNKLYNGSLVDLFSAIDKVNLIKVDLQATIDQMANNNILEGTNCKILRAEFQTLEETLCFGFVPNLYRFMIVAFVGSCLFFLLLWTLCCSTFCLERSGEHGSDAKKAESYDNTQFNPKQNQGNYYK